MSSLLLLLLQAVPESVAHSSQEGAKDIVSEAPKCSENSGKMANYQRKLRGTLEKLVTSVDQKQRNGELKALKTRKRSLNGRKIADNISLKKYYN